MLPVRIRPIFAVALSLGVHAGLLLWAVQPPSPPPPEPDLVRVTLTLPPEVKEKPAPPKAKPSKPVRAPEATPPARPPATLAAPPAPTAEEWQLAATYTLKNSKRYRYNWGQQVRSMMGTAIEGERQGMVRVRVEIAPAGTLAKVDVLWSTSELVEKLALQAIRAMPPLPPTPTGEPLIFEKTISLQPFETGWPPSYRYDCLPDPPQFKNPFGWNGAGAPPPAPPPTRREERAEDCHPSDVDASWEEEESELQRQIERNRWGR
ncbi:MAG: energy transducer TonB [Pseudomonadota bacterium]